jgi:type I restriction enzyme S subunit
MEVIKKGYQQTEIGVIPKDWKVVEIKDICDVDADNLTSSTSPNYEFNYISLENVNQGALKETTEMLFKDAPSRARRKIKKGDVLIATVRPNLKSHLLIKKDIENWICSTGFAVLSNKETLVNSEFIFNHFFSNIINNQIDNLISGSNYPAISNKDVKSLKIPLPPLPEQKAIAEVLSDMDNLITALERQIEKKRLVKQGAMQRLLTAGLDWEVKTLGEVGSFYNGKGHEQFIDKNGEYIVVNSKFISKEGRIYKSSNKNLFPLQKGDVTMVMSDIPNGKALAKCYIIPCDNKYTLNQRICAIRTDIVDNVFLALILNRNDYYLSFDSGTGQTNLKKDDVLNCPLLLPRTKPEQTRIAMILSDMDGAIAGLEKQLEKYRAMKVGLMQELLSGRKRLV